jgi:hypothetical protein
MYPRNAASPEPIAIGAVLLTADGTVQTSGVTVRVKPIGVSEADGGGTVAYSTDGVVIYTPTQAETNYTSFVLIAKKASCIPASITVITTASPTPGTVRMQSAADNAITFQSINDGAIGTGKMGANAITSSVIQADAINANKVADGTLTAAKFAAGAFDAVWSVAARTLTAASDSSGITTLLSRITALIRTKAEDDTADSTITGAIPSAAAVASQVRTELTAELDEIGSILAEAERTPRGTNPIARGSFTVEVVNGQVISGGQSVDMEYK